MPLTVSVEQLGPELRRRRQELGVSLRAVEKDTEISAATLSRIERGSTPDLVIIERLAEWLGVQVHAGGTAPTLDAQLEAPSVRSDDDLRRTIEIHLRANKHLDPALAQAIANTFEAVVRFETEKAAAFARLVNKNPPTTAAGSEAPPRPR